MKVPISKERYEELLKSEHELVCLQAAGVDNWSGYDYAMEMALNDDDEEYNFDDEQQAGPKEGL